MDETKLIGLFRDLTGEGETAARSVVMYLDMLEQDYFPNGHQEPPTEESVAPESAEGTKDVGAHGS